MASRDPLPILEERAARAVSERRHSGWRLFGWIFLAMAVLLTGAVVYRTWHYSGALRSGDLVVAPNLAFQVTRGQAPSISSVLVDPELVESTGRPSYGPEAAILTVVVFADFECPYCESEAPIFRRMMNKYGDRVKFIFRHYPIDQMHPDARLAAEAAECAHEQGKFWQFHDKVFFNPDTPTTATLTRYAEQVGLDRLQFDRCLSDGRYRDRIDEDISDAQAAGVTGTPTFFFNGQRLEGAIPEDIFDKLLEQLLIS
jgi:protein-disulfide isomerase